MTTPETLDRNILAKIKTRQLLSEAQNHRCCYCHVQFSEDTKSSYNATFEHIIPKSRGGNDDFMNLVVACYGCNSLRGNNISAVDFNELIQLAKNSAEQAQLAAVRKNGRAIKYIENPSESVQLAAVRQDGRAIKYIENPSESVQYAAHLRYKHAMRHIKNPAGILGVVSTIRNIKRYRF